MIITIIISWPDLLKFDLGEVNDLISITTPFILLIWFYYSQKQSLSKSYYNQVDGIYAGYTTPTIEAEGKFTKAGIILNVRDTDDNGYFKGEISYAELRQWSVNQEFYSQRVIEAAYTFLGKLDFSIYIEKSRHPFKPEKNRTYQGRLTIVDRLDFQFDQSKIEDYISAEYHVQHYREMQTMKFTLIKKYKPEFALLPESFIVYKSMGFEFEPFTSVKADIFGGEI